MMSTPWLNLLNPSMLKTDKHKKNIIIIGAGLSGLYTTTLLQNTFNIILLEARDRIGGRIVTKEGHDLGPSWVWPHHKNMLKLISSLGLELFSQFTKGDALYHTRQGVQRFNAPPSAPAARLEGGLQKLVDALAAQLNQENIFLNQKVKKISYANKKLTVETPLNRFEADYVISTLPPRLASENITYSPALHKEIHEKMLQTHTWMGNSAKCVIEFQRPFWRDEGLSGFVFSHAGPLSEIHDACTKGKAALFGFVHPKALMDTIEDDVREQMHALFSKKSDLIENIYFIDWREEKFSSTRHDRQGLHAHPAYGLDLTSYDDKLFFIGTETAYEEGGYLEGAVNSALKITELFSR